MRTAEIWTDDPRGPAVALVRAPGSGGSRWYEATPTVPGINVVVGDRFTGVRRGDKDVAIVDDTTVCSPPILT